MKSSPPSSSDLLTLAHAALAEVRKHRPLHESDPTAALPVSFGVNHQPVDPFSFEVGKWTATPWSGITCYGISLSLKEVVIICQVESPIRMEPQEHGPWSERLVMERGILYEHTTNQTFSAGNGIYEQPAGEVHEPEFKTPSRCMITWTRE